MTIWTEEVAEEIKRMWTEGNSAGQIARAINGPLFHVSRNAVIGKLHRMGLTGQHGGRYSGVARATVPRAARQPRAKPRPAVTPLNEIVTCPVALLEAGPAHCRWPLWDLGPHADRLPPAQIAAGDLSSPSGPLAELEYPVCGSAKFGEGPYCEGHAAASRGHGQHHWKPGDPRRRRYGQSAAKIYLEAAE